MRIAAVVVEPVGADLVALAQCHALDATVFPHPSLPPVLGSGAPTSIWVARGAPGAAVIGFAAARVERAALSIAGLAVDGPYRRAGVGRLLLRGVARSAGARGLRRVTLHVSTGNMGAVALYESEGFTKVERLSRYYSPRRFPDGGDAWLMALDLDRDLDF